MTTTNWINLGVAIGTIGLAVVALVQLLGSKAALEAMQQSAKATERTAQAMRAVATASFRPTLAVGLSPDCLPEHIGERIPLRLTNKGGGPAFLRHVTGRNDVETYALHRFALKDVVVGLGESVEFCLPCRHKDFVSSERTWITSVSLWYQDVDGAWFRTRALMSFRAPQVSLNIEAVEHIDYTNEPIISSENNKETSIDRLEGGFVVPLHGPLLNMHKVATQAGLVGRAYPGGPATGNRAVEVRDIAFFTPDGWPTLGLLVPGHEPFDLSWSGGVGKPAVVEVTEPGTRRVGTAGWSVQDNIATTANVEQFGLKDSKDLKGQLNELYQGLMRALGAEDLWQI